MRLITINCINGKYRFRNREWPIQSSRWDNSQSFRFLSWYSVKTDAYVLADDPVNFPVIHEKWLTIACNKRLVEPYSWIDTRCVTCLSRFNKVLNYPHRIKVPSARTHAPSGENVFRISHRVTFSSLLRVMKEKITKLVASSENMTHIDEKSGKTVSPLGARVWAEGIFMGKVYRIWLSRLGKNVIF